MLSSTSAKILIRSPNWIGDTVMATPVPHAFKQSQPNCQVHVLARAWVAPLWEGHPDVDKIIVLPPARGWNHWRPWLHLVSGLRQEHYDLGLMLPTSFSSAWLNFWAGCLFRVGYNTDGRRWLLHLALPEPAPGKAIPRPQAYLQLVRAAGVEVDQNDQWNFILKVTSQELAEATALLGERTGPKRIGLAPGSVAKSRRWPILRFAQLADRLMDQGYQVYVLGSPADYPLAQAMAQHAQHKLQILAGQTSLRLALAIIRQLDLLVSNDSGSMHLAYAQHVPVLVLQGAADFHVTGPFGPYGNILRATGLSCSPCVKNECPEKHQKCMEQISVAQVWEAVQAILSQRVARARQNEY